MWKNGSSPKARVLGALKRLGIGDLKSLGALSNDHKEDEHPLLEQPGPVQARSPITGEILTDIPATSISGRRKIDRRARASFATWKMTPAPQRGEFVRRLGLKFREFKNELAELITWEVGKIPQESLGEVQEMIDICDFAVGLSRQLHGLTIASERPRHRLMEQWHPLGPVLVITAFNFPMAVWSWNAALAWVCGNSVIWKPSEKTPLCALAVHALVKQVLAEMPEVPEGIASLLLGDRTAVNVHWTCAKLISATGSTRMGYEVAQAAQLKRTLLELGGNNGMIVAPSADLELAVRAIVFGAVGTCGQRCTTLRRLFVHESRYLELRDRLLAAYRNLPIGDPTKPGVLVGPLIDQAAFESMQEALSAAREEGGTVHFGDRVTEGVPAGGFYVRPSLVEMPARVVEREHSGAELITGQTQHEDGTTTSFIMHSHGFPPHSIMDEETFAPILYMASYKDLEQAIQFHNDVPQGLSSAILTNDIREAELFCSPAGSDCGLVNVNCGTSGAEIGGAFGGEKETGGGRESGSDAWKNYMRRVTSTINWSGELPLAQGIQFEL